MLKIAECFSYSDFDTAKSLFNTLSKIEDKEIDMCINKFHNLKKLTKTNENYIKIERYISKFAIDKSIVEGRMKEILEELNNYSGVKI